jgi:hypothetical protein
MISGKLGGYLVLFSQKRVKQYTIKYVKLISSLRLQAKLAIFTKLNFA